MGHIRAIMSQAEWDIIELFGAHGSVYLWYDPTQPPKGENLNWDQACVAERLVEREFIKRDQRADEDWCVYYTITPKCMDQTMVAGQAYIITVGGPKKRTQVGDVFIDDAQEAYDCAKAVFAIRKPGDEVAVVALDDYQGAEITFDEFDVMWVIG